MIRVKRIQSALVILFTIHCSLFTSSAVAQDISQIAKSDPLVITGAVGTQNTYYYSSVGDGYSSPLSNMLFVNMNISVYGFSMPFSLYYSNDNLSFNYPHLSFNLNPRYKNWTGYVGRGSMAFSQYVMDMSFNGLGVEYDDGKRWRFGAFYGQLRKAINEYKKHPDDAEMILNMATCYTLLGDDNSSRSVLKNFLRHKYDQTISFANEDYTLFKEQVLEGRKQLVGQLK